MQLFVEQPVLLFHFYELFLLLENGLSELSINLLLFFLVLLFEVRPFQSFPGVLEFDVLELVLFEEHLVEFFVFFVLIFELYDLELVVLLLVLQLEVQFVVVPLCHLERVLDLLDLVVQFVHLGFGGQCEVPREVALRRHRLHDKFCNYKLSDGVIITRGTASATSAAARRSAAGLCSY